PDNIMVREDGLVKVLDFGLVKLADMNDSEESLGSDLPSHTQLHTLPGVVMGTVRYMSPEQARGKTVDARTDIWSLGVVLYELLSGQAPFAGETANDVIASILRSDPAPLPEEMPAELCRIITKSLQKNADERYQTAKDMAVDLKNLEN